MAFALAALLATYALTVTYTVRPLGFDLHVYLEAARAVASGRSPYLAPDAPECSTTGCFLYPPPVAVIFIPLLALPPDVAIWTVVALLTGLAAAVCTVLVAPLPRSVRPWAATSFVLFIPLLLELGLGNVNLVTMALALAAWASRDRPVRGGVLLALAVGLKLLVGTLVLFYIAAGRWRQVAWAATAVILAALATAPWVGTYWPEFVPVLARQATGNVGGIRSETFGGAGHVAAAMVAVAVAVSAGLGARRSADHARDLHGLALAAAPLIASGIYYTFLVLTLPLLAALTRALAPRPALLALPALAWLAMEMPPGSDALRSSGLLATVALGTLLFLRPALARRA